MYFTRRLPPGQMRVMSRELHSPLQPKQTFEHDNGIISISTTKAFPSHTHGVQICEEKQEHLPVWTHHPHPKFNLCSRVSFIWGRASTQNFLQSVSSKFCFWGEGTPTPLKIYLNQTFALEPWSYLFPVRRRMEPDKRYTQPKMYKYLLCALCQLDNKLA